MKILKNKTVFIIGASAGIGKACAYSFRKIKAFHALFTQGFWRENYFFFYFLAEVSILEFSYAINEFLFQALG